MQIRNVPDQALELMRGYRRGDASGEDRERDNRNNHPNNRQQPPRERRRATLRGTGLGHRYRGPPDAGRQALDRMPTEMVVLPSFKNPDQHPDDQGYPQQRQHSLQKFDG